MKLKVMNKIITRIPPSAMINNDSASVSSLSFPGFDVRIEKNENILEKINDMATTEVSSSIILASA